MTTSRAAPSHGLQNNDLPRVILKKSAGFAGGNKVPADEAGSGSAGMERDSEEAPGRELWSLKKTMRSCSARGSRAVGKTLSVTLAGSLDLQSVSLLANRQSNTGL